ncbi:pentatricopeptide repeat-containing protein At1g26900, mitochondrial-like [Zingiber officinale]|uniref:Pentatricopeptide repeat-containing protein n=1 Tax=Zingiber officinale TaxID=94328 RepID=A0A8J5FBI0_ZINOF|nr:pentatricopeptide repeat-containing protein At1g26900, mitochondrial-like [Zingiber officinale]KAG6484222.1 hypothetical protein ZIOFF_061017 [Zingiber officinale]
MPAPSNFIDAAHRFPLLSRLLRTSRLTPLQLRQAHACMLKTGLHLLPFPVSKLLAAASSLAEPAYARSIFDCIASPCLFHHTAVLRSLSSAPGARSVADAIALFRSLHASPGLALNQFAFIPTLKVLAQGLRLQLGRQLHALALKLGFLLYVNVRNTLIHLYCRCGRVSDDGLYLFDEMPLRNDAVSWSALMSGYLQQSETEKVVALFLDMHRCFSEINAAALVNTFSALVDLSCCSGGETLHAYCVKSSFDSNLNVATAIADMYAKSKRMDSAAKVFDAVKRKDLVLYNCIVAGYAKAGAIEEAFAVVAKMKDEGIKPASSTFAGLLEACSSSGALMVGRRIHERIETEKVTLDAVLGTALVDMYSKTGCLDEALEVFAKMAERDVQAWTAMIKGLGINGRAEEALELFGEMEASGAEPNAVTFLSVLSACGHGGLVEAGKQCLERMVGRYGLVPGKEHYGCLIDLFGRAGMLEEAYELIERLPVVRGCALAWQSLLAGCRIHGNVEVGELAQKNLAALGDEHPSNVILLSGAYAVAGRRVDATLLESTAGEPVEKKEAGLSIIAMDSYY